MTPHDSRIRAYLELLRLPNVFTAMADVLMGAFFVTVSSIRPELPTLRLSVLASLLGSSSCLYLAGMVLNDYFDRAKDAVERPARPIPSRRVQESAARWLGSELLIIGVALAWIASYLVGGWRAGLIAILLAGCVVLYDGLLKSTWLGPLGMGACRALNVLLGMSAASHNAVPWVEAHYLVASGIGVYIVGVTWFARTEAQLSSRISLVASTIVIWLGMLMLAVFPRVYAWPTFIAESKLSVWYFFWFILGAQIGWRCLRAAFHPIPVNVQTAVKQCILSLIVLDATVTFAVQGTWPAVTIIALLVPTMFLGRWIYST